MNTKIISNLPLSTFNTNTNIPNKDPQVSFANVLKNAIENVNTLQAVSDAKTNAFINGKDIDLHDVMITAQKASIALETTVQVQKRVIDAYNEIMRMQV